MAELEARELVRSNAKATGEQLGAAVDRRASKGTRSAPADHGLDAPARQPSSGFDHTHAPLIDAVGAALSRALHTLSPTVSTCMQQL